MRAFYVIRNSQTVLINVTCNKYYHILIILERVTNIQHFFNIFHTLLRNFKSKTLKNRLSYLAHYLKYVK